MILTTISHFRLDTLMKHNLPANYNRLSQAGRKEVRNQYIENQNGKCFFCFEDLQREPPKEILDKDIDWGLFPNGFLKYPVHLQHDHNTELTEGAVHAYCNAVMWQYERR